MLKKLLNKIFNKETVNYHKLYYKSMSKLKEKHDNREKNKYKGYYVITDDIIAEMNPKPRHLNIKKIERN